MATPHEEVVFLNLVLAQSVVEATFYGLYSATVFMSAYILIRNGVFNSKARATLLLVTVTMFAISTVHLILHAITFKIQFPILDDPINPPGVVRLYTRLVLGQELLRRASYFLSDVVVVWRTWCIWYQNTPVRLFLALCILATFATSLTTAILDWFQLYRHYNFVAVRANLLGTLCLLITNFSTTMLCAVKVWEYRKMMKILEGSTNTKVGNILLILLESGAIYCIFWVLMLVGDFGRYGDFGFEWTQPHFSGLYVSAIILLVSFEKTSSNAFFSTISAGGNTSNTPSRPIAFATPKHETILTIDPSTSYGTQFSASSNDTSMSRDSDVERGEPKVL